MATKLKTGRKGVDPEVKRITGNPSHKPIPQAIDERSLSSILPPFSKKSSESKIWVDILEKVFWLKASDYHCVKLYCEAVILYTKFKREIDNYLALSSKKGFEPSKNQLNSYIVSSRNLRHTRQDIIKLLMEMGITPTERVRFAQDLDEKEKDKYFN